MGRLRESNYGASDLDRRVTFQRQTMTPDGGGGSTRTWADIQTVWAMVQAQSVQQRWFAGQLENQRNYMVVIRYGILTVDPSMRIRYEISPAIYLKINGVNDSGEDRTFLEIDAQLEFNPSN